jgi:MFS family permease
MLGFALGATIGFAITGTLIPRAVAAGTDPFLDESFGYTFFLLVCPAILIFGPLFGWLGSRIGRKPAGRAGCASLLIPGTLGLAGGIVLSLVWYLLVAYTG